MTIPEKRRIRQLAVELLDSDIGVTGPAWTILHDVLRHIGAQDIISEVRATDNTFYIPGIKGIELRKSL